MGVRGLQKFLKQYATEKSIDDLLNPNNAKLKIGIDISYYMYRWQADVEKILDFIHLLQTNRHRIVLVFDGRAEEGKQAEAQRRRQIREEELKSAQAIFDILEQPPEDMTEEQMNKLRKEAEEHQKRGWSFTKDIRHSVKNRLYEEKVPMVKAKGEADGLLAAMSARGDLDLVISGDMDLIAMGTKVMWSPFEDGFHFLEYNRETILQELSLSDYQFRSMCAMCFVEISGISTPFDIRQAYQAMRLYKSLTSISKRHPHWLATWPNDNHIFYRSVDQVDAWIREDQFAIYKAFLNCEPMPYT